MVLVQRLPASWSCAASAGYMVLCSDCGLLGLVQRLRATWSCAATAGYMVLWYTLSMEGASLRRLGCCLGLHPRVGGRLRQVAALHALLRLARCALSMEGASLHRLGCCLGLHPRVGGRLRRVAALHGLLRLLRCMPSP